MGRITQDSKRNRIQNTMKNLHGYYYEALKDNKLQEAFMEIWRDWNNEQAAMIYSPVISAYDLLNLTGVLANRREINELKKRIDELENHASS